MISGLLDTIIWHSLGDQATREDRLLIDFTAPALPLFKAEKNFPSTCAVPVFQMFNLFWIDESAAIRSLRFCVESLLAASKLDEIRRLEDHLNYEESADKFMRWRSQKEFKERVNDLHNDTYIRRAFSALWDCGSFYSHFTPDAHGHHSRTEYLDSAVILFHSLLLAISRSEPSSISEKDLEKIEKAFCKRAQEKRLQEVFSPNGIGFF